MRPRRFTRSLALVVALAACPGTAVPVRADDAATWQALQATGPSWHGWRPLFYADVRYDLDDRGWLGSVVRAGVRRDLAPGVSASAWYGRIEVRPAPGARRADHDRAELELTLRPALQGPFDFAWRNRYEFRWFDGTAGRSDRFRSRMQLGWRPPPGLPFDRAFVQQEWLFGIHDGRLSESRTIPLGLEWRLCPHVRFQLQAMHRSVRTASGWFHENVAATLVLIE